MKTSSSIQLACLVMLLLLSACGKKETHFLGNESYRQRVHTQFEERKKEFSGRRAQLLQVFEQEDLNLEEREALEFLYAYMPLCDLADYDGDFFLKQIRTAFEARDYFAWGRTVPEGIFRHFVLVHRINNEYMDTARTVFFEELKDRIKGLSMYDAALEVNHWCHEKVTYRGTDVRTSAPLALVRTSWGRCGEESTFTTTALRAVGIPARQCYTPRWVHTDDNHAWVEVWIDGKWHYLGACEPEPELDRGWFTAPAKRAMMVHTNVYGLYEGPEEKNMEAPLYSIINLLGNYTETRKVNVKVVDESGNPLENVRVQFKVYNYAELYPVAEQYTNESGHASIISGKGDLMVWVSKGDKYAYAKSEPKDELTEIVLNKTPGTGYEETYEMNVPPEQAVTPLSQEKVGENRIRLAKEDSVRNAYMSTFATEEYAKQLALREKLNPQDVWHFLHAAQGNWQEIEQFIQERKTNPYLFPFLYSLSAKDLRDTPATILLDHLLAPDQIEVKKGTPENMIVPYILSPRIDQELIRLWRSKCLQVVGKSDREYAREHVAEVVAYIKSHVKIKEEENYYNCRLTPLGAFELGISDARSRDILFVAVCRGLGIPAQIEIATGKPQYYENGHWIDVAFEPDSSTPSNLKKVKLTLKNDPKNLVKPGYYTHYTLAFYKDGDFQTLDMESDPITENFPYDLHLDAGYYRLMMGSRANDGSVTVNTRYFTLTDKPQQLTVSLPEVKGKLFVKGIVDMNTIVRLDDNSKPTLKDLSKGKGLVVCFLDLRTEPSKHILQDLPSVKSELEEWGGGVVFILPDDGSANKSSLEAFKNLPGQAICLTDFNKSLLNSTTSALQLNFRDEYPLAIFLSDNGGILLSSTGYRIGIGEDMLKTIKMQ